jgi:DNA-binding NtrC family response regulator
MQGKLLRVLQDRSFQRIGGKEILESDTRIITATNQDLAKMVREGKFREDLYYRLQVMRIHLPSLRERKSDIPLLARYFARRAGYNSLPLSRETESFLLNYDWPGNVRELENAIQRALVLSRGKVITIDQLRPVEGLWSAEAETKKEPALDGIAVHSLEQALQELWTQILDQQEKNPLKVFYWLETELAKLAMQETGDNQVQAAKLLGISRNTLRQRLGL